MPLQPHDPASFLVTELLQEKQRDRRWKNIRFIAWFVLFAYIAIAAFGHCKHSPVAATSGKKYAALVRISGMIAPGRDLSAEELVPVLEEAFRDHHAEGVIIDINSPGGTPVQAAIIHDAIVTFKKKYHKRVIVVGEDLLTSGAYYVAVAADQIYVNANTLTGSIGVIMKGFGFVGIMQKYGIERRVYTAGEDKDRLDPFLPQSPDDIKKIKEVMSHVHANFEQAVLEGRRGRLHADPSVLFTGDFWSGDIAMQLGLVDGLGNLLDISEKEFHTTTFKEYGSTPGLLKMLSDQLGSSYDGKPLGAVAMLAHSPRAVLES
jgi:protease-4